MKNTIQTTFFVVLLLMMGVGCKKEETKVFFEGGTPPVLTPGADTIAALSVATKANQAIAFTWTNPNYNFTTGISSQDVSYILQIDKAGANFSSPTKQEISIAKELSTSMTVAEFNGLLTKMALEADKPYDIEVRVISSIKGAVPLISNVVKFTNVVPYEDFAILPPLSNELFIVGSATPKGWDNPVPVPSQKFTTVKKGLYELTLSLTGGQSFLFLPVNGSWDDKYGGANKDNNTNNVDGDLIKRGGSDLKAPAANGNYKITVDFKLGKYTVTKV